MYYTFHGLQNMARIFNIVSSAMWSTAPILTALATFAVYSAFYGNLTPATAFTAVSLFNVLRFPLTMFPNTITSGLAKECEIVRPKFVGTFGGTLGVGDQGT